MKDQWISLKHLERKRTYLFPGGETIALTGVTALYPSSSGTHYLECNEGKVIVQKGWLAIVLDMDKWTYPPHDVS